MKWKTDFVQTAQVEVSPALAKEMLETSPGNRKIRGWWVDAMAAGQRRGEWRLTNQGLGFDWNGALRDGHHRLMACAQSGEAIKTLVTTGLDPASFDAVDQGLVRNLSDITGLDRRIAEPLKLATMVARGSARVTTEQVREVACGGVQTALAHLNEYCGTIRRYYASAPMRLAAAITMMNGGDVDFVLAQYRALCLLDFDAMTACSKGLVRQVDSAKTRAVQTRETLARGMRVFDVGRASISKIQVSEADVVASTALVRQILLESIGEGGPRPAKITLRERFVETLKRGAHAQ